MRSTSGHTRTPRTLTYHITLHSLFRGPLLAARWCDLSHLGTTASCRGLPQARTHLQQITMFINLGPSSPTTTHLIFPLKMTPHPTHSWPPTGTPPPTQASSGRHIGDWGMRAGVRESPGRPLGPGRPPPQGPPRVVPDEAAAPWSRTTPAPRLRQPLKGIRKRRICEDRRI